MTGAVSIRDQLHTLLGAEFPEIPSGRRYRRKLDVIEARPSSAIYLGEMNAEPTANRGHRQQDQEIVVEIHREDTDDLESQLAGECDDFEAAVEASRRAGDFPEAMGQLWLSAVVMSFDPDARGRAGTLSMTFTAELHRSL